MNCKIHLQNASSQKNIPTQKQFKTWVSMALDNQCENLFSPAITIRIVDENESASLNQQYRKKSGPTNILSFPYQQHPGIKSSLLGDLVICAPIVIKEAAKQNKNITAHWSHLVIHGTLHLLGYDHIQENEAQKMESLEILLLKQLGYPNPYMEND